MSIKQRLVLASLPFMAAIAFAFMHGPGWIIITMLVVTAEIIAFLGPDYI